MNGEQTEKPVTERNPRAYDIPPKIRSLVYLVGMLGFPVVVAGYVLVVLSSDLKGVDRRLSSLATRIDERPMGLDRTTDFVIYVTNSLKNELKAGLPELAEEVDLVSLAEEEKIIRDVNRLQRRIESYIRPIVRRHKRFAERFPSVGGNLGSHFVLSAPAEPIGEGDSEGYLAAQASKDVGEALAAMMGNNMSDFGHPMIENFMTTKKSTGNALLDMMLGIDSGGASDSPDSPEAMLAEIQQDLRSGSVRGADPQLESIPTPGEPRIGTSTALDGRGIELMTKELFVELFAGAIDTAITALRDQMLLKVRTQGSDFDRSSQTNQ